jgi:integrase
VLNKKKISRYIGEHVKTVKDRAYTIEEIKKILSCCNLKYKIVVTLMASTGCRIGAIASLKVKHLKYYKKLKLHQVFFYTNTKEEYYSFTTPECSNYIFEYLDYRTRCGEQINQESPLIRNDFQQDDMIRIQRPKPQTTYNFQFYLYEILITAGIRTPVKQDQDLNSNPKNNNNKKRMRTEISANHGFRKFVHTTMTHAKILPEVREMLLGHKIGLSGAYYKPTEDEMLSEYLKVVNDLTINDEFRLSKQVQHLKEKEEHQEFIIHKKMKEKDEQIHFLTSSMENLNNKILQMVEKIESIDPDKNKDHQTWKKAWGKKDRQSREEGYNAFVRYTNEELDLEQQIKDEILKHKSRLLEENNNK